MKALKVLAARRKAKVSSSDRNRHKPNTLITSVNIGFIRTIGRDLAILAWKDSDLPTTRMLNELGANNTPSGLLPLEPHLAPVIFNLFLGLAYFDNSANDASWKLRRYIMQLSAWTPTERTSSQQAADAASKRQPTVTIETVDHQVAPPPTAADPIIHHNGLRDAVQGILAGPAHGQLLMQSSRVPGDTSDSVTLTVCKTRSTDSLRQSSIHL